MAPAFGEVKTKGGGGTFKSEPEAQVHGAPTMDNLEKE
jgi:hypothetical protein